MMPSLAPTPRPTAPTGTLPANFEAAIVAQLRIEGSAFATLLSSNRAGLETAITADLGTLLQIAASFIRVTNMVVGSLVVTFAVSASAGVQPSTLNSRLAEATASTSWLSSTQSVYSTVSNETLRVTEAPNVLVTAAPDSVTTGAPTTAAPTTAAPSGSPSARPSPPCWPSPPPSWRCKQPRRVPRDLSVHTHGSGPGERKPEQETTAWETGGAERASHNRRAAPPRRGCTPPHPIAHRVCLCVSLPRVFPSKPKQTGTL